MRRRITRQIMWIPSSPQYVRRNPAAAAAGTLCNYNYNNHVGGIGDGSPSRKRRRFTWFEFLFFFKCCWHDHDTNGIENLNWSRYWHWGSDSFFTAVILLALSAEIKKTVRKNVEFWRAYNSTRIVRALNYRGKIEIRGDWFVSPPQTSC